MDQSRYDNYRFGYDMQQAIADFCLLYPDGTDASGPGANQGAGDDRVLSAPFSETRSAVDSGQFTEGIPGLVPNLDHSALSWYTSYINEAQEQMIVGTFPELYSEVCPTITASVSTFDHALSSHISLPIDATSEIGGVDQMSMPNSMAAPCNGENGPFSTPSANTAFRFESGSTIIEDNSRPQRKRPDTGIKCEVLGCKYRGSFNRVYDLARHMKTHSNAAEKCPVEHCDRFFTRWDRLPHHFRTGHDDTCELICSEPECSKAIPFLLLGKHYNSMHGYSIIMHASRRLKNDLRSCPIVSCKHNKKLLSCDSIQDHLLKHSPKERIHNNEAILAAGYHPGSLALICPVCKAELQSNADFADHIEDEHIFSDRNYREKFRRSRREFWYASLWRSDLTDYIAEQFHLDKELHNTYLSPDTYYAHHRFAILRLWPYFQHHPLFDEYRYNRD